MTDPTREAISAERREQADMLAALSEEDWGRPTLCAGWRVREVVAHTTRPFRTSAVRLVLDLVAARGSFNRMADRGARQDASQMTPDELLTAVRTNVDHPWTPPGGGPSAALAHDVIHGLDITTALGLDRRVPLDRLTVVLDAMTPHSVAFFGADLTGVRLQATDLDWSYGQGEPVRGLAQDLLLVICGRQLPSHRLAGEATHRFTAAGAGR